MSRVYRLTEMNDEELSELLDSLNDDELLDMQLQIIEQLEANGDTEGANELLLLLAEANGLIH